MKFILQSLHSPPVLMRGGVDEEDGHAGAHLGKGECRAQPRGSCADDDAVEIVCHVLRFRAEHTRRVGLAQQAGPRVYSSTKNLTE